MMADIAKQQAKDRIVNIFVFFRTLTCVVKKHSPATSSTYLLGQVQPKTPLPIPIRARAINLKAQGKKKAKVPHLNYTTPVISRFAKYCPAQVSK